MTRRTSTTAACAEHRRMLWLLWCSSLIVVVPLIVPLVGEANSVPYEGTVDDCTPLQSKAVRQYPLDRYESW
jgi:hypothetical protein